jgi:hypothetical protein
MPDTVATAAAAAPPVGFAPDEIDLSLSTRQARLKWVVVVDARLPAGRAVNAAVCAASATVAGVRGLLGPDVIDGSGMTHPGIPWTGCSVLSADAEHLRSIHERAAADPDMFVADMPNDAQHIRVYADYLDRVAGTKTEDLGYLVVSVVGPRNRVAKLVKGLTLLD